MQLHCIVYSRGPIVGPKYSWHVAVYNMNWQNFNSRALDKHVALNNMLIQMEQMEEHWINMLLWTTCLSRWNRWKTCFRNLFLDLMPLAKLCMQMREIFFSVRMVLGVSSKGSPKYHNHRRGMSSQSFPPPSPSFFCSLFRWPLYPWKSEWPAWHVEYMKVLIGMGRNVASSFID